MEQNMQQTIEKMESKTSLLLTKTQTLKLSIEQATIDKQKQESSHKVELETLRAEIAQTKEELREAKDQLATLREESEKKEDSHAELKQSNDELHKENQVHKIRLRTLF